MPDEKYLTPDPPPPPEDPPRGGCLSLFLLVFIVYKGFLVYINIRRGEYLPVLIESVGIVCALGVWLWQKYAFWGLLAVTAFAVAFYIDNQSLQLVMYNLVFLALAYVLVQPKMEYLK